MTIASLLLAAALAATPPAAPRDPAVDRLAQELAAAAMDAGAGVVVVKRAYVYGPTKLFSNVPGHHWVAVEVTFQGYQRGFDLDDIEVLDADRNERQDSGPEMGFFDARGRFAGWYDVDVGNGPDLRTLLVFSLPLKVTSIQLWYADEVLHPKIAVAPTGPVYPDPHGAGQQPPDTAL